MQNSLQQGCSKLDHIKTIQMDVHQMKLNSIHIFNKLQKEH